MSRASLAGHALTKPEVSLEEVLIQALSWSAPPLPFGVSPVDTACACGEAGRTRDGISMTVSCRRDIPSNCRILLDCQGPMIDIAHNDSGAI